MAGVYDGGVRLWGAIGVVICWRGQYPSAKNWRPGGGCTRGGVTNPTYHFSSLLFGIHILHTKKSTSQILHTPYHFQTFKSPIPKNSMTKSCIPKKIKDKSCFRVFYLGSNISGNFLSSIIFRLQRGQGDLSIILLEMLSGQG